MAKKELLELRFPAGGLNRRRALKEPPPFTTSDCVNVRSDCSIKGRERGGSRPGLAKAFDTFLNAVPQFIDQLPIVSGNGFGFWEDPFDGEILGNWWKHFDFAGELPPVGSEPLAGVTYQETGGAVRTLLDFRLDMPYTIGIRIMPRAGAYHGTYTIYARMDNTTPDATDEGIVVSFTSTASDGTYSATLTSYAAGVPTTYTYPAGDLGTPIPIWFCVLVYGDTIRVYVGALQIFDETADTHTGSRFGFGLSCTSPGGFCLIDVIRATYYEEATDEHTRNILVVGANGYVYRETNFRELTAFYGTPFMPTQCLRTQGPISTASRNGLLFITDYGLTVEGGPANIDQREGGGAWFLKRDVLDIPHEADADKTHVCVISYGEGAVVDGTYAFENWIDDELELLGYTGGAGACSFRVERGPKIYNPVAETVVLWMATADKGQVPVGCRFVCRFRDRMVLAGDPTYAWYMSRQGDPYDWDYGADPEDAGRAIAGISAEAGQLAESLTAVVPHRDDYLLFCCRDSLWVLRGDPGYGGQIDNISRTIGVIGPRAWCRTPEGIFIFLSRDGLYALAPGAPGEITSLSREKIPQELLNVDYSNAVISLEFDVRDRGVHIYLTPVQPGTIWRMK